MSWVQAGIARLRRLGRPDETTERTGIEAKIKEVMDDCFSRLREDVESGGRGPWIFTQRPDPEVYVAAILEICADERNDGIAEGAHAAYQHAELECVCRCRAHHRTGCPFCVQYESCAVHGDANPETLRPALLSDPYVVARALHRALGTHLPGMPDWDDPDLDQDYARAMVEAAAEVVASRIKP